MPTKQAKLQSWARRKLAKKFGAVLAPGSRGGNVIGYTRSGNPIYGPRDQDVKALETLPKKGDDPVNTMVGLTRPIREIEDHAAGVAVKGQFSSRDLKDAIELLKTKADVLRKAGDTMRAKAHEIMAGGLKKMRSTGWPWPGRGSGLETVGAFRRGARRR